MPGLLLPGIAALHIRAITPHSQAGIVALKVWLGGAVMGGEERRGEEVGVVEAGD